MKWARVVDNPERATKNASPDDRLSIRFISRDDLKQNFGMWSQYKFPPNFKVTTRGIRDYEMMVGGFLLYYDDIVRNAVVDHAVYLEWDLKEIEHSAKDDKDGRTKKYICSGLSIYLHPKPLRKLSDKYPSVHTASQAPPLHEPVRNHLQDVEATATPAPDFGDFVDPPPPPPPPPPSLDDSMTPGP